MNDLSKLQILYVVIGVVFGLIVMFGNQELVGGDHGYVLWGWLFVVGGAFAVCGAVFNWSFFMNDNAQTSRALREFLGESVYRCVMVVLGVFLIFCGLLLTKAIEF